MAIVFRTTSDLPLADNPAPDALVQISQPMYSGNATIGYASQKVLFRNFSDAVISGSVIKAREDFQVPEGTSISSDVIEPLGSILSGENVAISGKKIFSVRPEVSDTSTPLSANSLATMGDVEVVVDSTAFCFSTNSQISASPDNSAGYTRNDGNLLMWHIDAGQRDSSLWVDPATGKAAGYLKCPSTGMLVMYGWLADNGNLNPEECWVGLFAKILNGDGVVRPTLIQAQPWIVGKNSQTVQYVGFTLPVRQGLELKVMTGFNVNGESSGFGNANSLMMSGVGSLVNTFVGYIAKGQVS